MKIIVPIKQIPKSEQVAVDPVTHSLIRDNDTRMNPYDKFALEVAFRLAEAAGDEVIALTMGPAQSERVLIEAIAMGASSAVLLSDRKFAGADTLATAYTIAKAIEKIGLDQVRLVIFGQQAQDADTGQVGPLVSAGLGLPQITYITQLPRLEGNQVTARRSLGYADQELSVRTPAVLTISNQLSDELGSTLSPRFISLQRLVRRDKEKSLTTWGAADIEADEARVGLAGSPSVVRGMVKPHASVRGQQRVVSLEEMVEQTLSSLQAAGFDPAASNEVASNEANSTVSSDEEETKA